MTVLKGREKKDQELGNLSPKKADEKLGAADLRKQLNGRGRMKPNTIRASTEQMKQKSSSSCLTA